MKLTLLLLSVSIAFLPGVARADYPRSICGKIGGYQGCAADYGNGGNDLLVINGPEGVERIRVQCNEKDYTWQSYGPNTEPLVDGVARSWCGD